MRAEDRESSSGFTLIELLIVVAIIAVILGTAIPSAQNWRVVGNESVAVQTLREIAHAQEMFRLDDPDGDNIPDYAGSVAELAKYGLIDIEFVDDPLGGGVTSGFHFIVGPPYSSPPFHWYGIGGPAVPGLSGSGSFRADETGVVERVFCPPGQHAVLVNGQVKCVPFPATPGPVGEALGIAAMDAANLISGGLALSAAQENLPSLSGRILEELDADRDTRVSYEEILSADVLAMADRIAGSAPVQGGPTRAPDALLTFILDGFQLRLKQDAALHPTEKDLPGVPIASLVGHPEAALELVSPTLPFGSLNVLEGLIDGLDPDPTAGQMTAHDLATNAQRKASMLESARTTPSLLRFGKLEDLQASLGLIRDRTDGAPAIEDWVSGESATQIKDQVDRTLALLGSH